MCSGSAHLCSQAVVLRQVLVLPLKLDLCMTGDKLVGTSRYWNTPQGSSISCSRAYAVTFLPRLSTGARCWKRSSVSMPASPHQQDRCK